MTERPILFSGAMVLALLDDRKTHTRRIVTRDNLKIYTGGLDFAGKCISPDEATFQQAMTDAHGFKMCDDLLTWRAKAFDYQNADFTRWTARCRFGSIGDRLWVRENFAIVPATAYRMSEGVQQTVNPNDPDMAAIYAAGWDRSIPKWKPSIHMPRWASRITLEITDIRVERLQDISEADAIAEGIPDELYDQAEHACSAGHPRNPWVLAYSYLWESINGAGSWDANPWVWVVAFKRVP